MYTEVYDSVKKMVMQVFLFQVLMKIRNELAHARMDLERAIRGNCGVIFFTCT